MMVAQDDAARCSEVLHKANCILYACKKECFQKHNSLGGSCIAEDPSRSNPIYDCVCAYNC